MSYEEMKKQLFWTIYNDKNKKALTTIFMVVLFNIQFKLVTTPVVSKKKLYHFKVRTSIILKMSYNKEMTVKSTNGHIDALKYRRS